MRQFCFQAHRVGRWAGGATRSVRANSRLPASNIMEAPPKQLAVVRSDPDENIMSISILLAGVQRSMRRAKQESLETTLARIQTNAMPKAKKQKSKGGGRRSPSPHNRQKPTVVLMNGLSAIEGGTHNDAAWRHGNVLHVGDSSYQVVRDPPTVDKVVVHGKPMVGYPMCPLPTLRFAQLDDCGWQWYRKVEGDWQNIEGANKLIYVPGEEDFGKRLRVTCTPSGQIKDSQETWKGQAGEAVVAAVTRGPPLGPGHSRHPLTQQHLEAPGFRVVTYNLLADQYMATQYAQDTLFSYCPPEFREAEYRQPLALTELLGFNADILCLQEVDEKAFNVYFCPQLEAAGYSGFYSNKDGTSREGCALFYRSARFSCASQQTLSMKKLAADIVTQEDVGDRHSQLLPILQSSASLRHNLQQVATIAQMILLVARQPCQTESSLCIVNTHLFFHPRANHIRSVHTAAMLREAEAFIQKWRVPGDPEPALLFCGDLNSGCNKGIPGNLELLGSGTLDASYWDWESGKTFRFVKDLEEQVGGEGTKDEKDGSNCQSEQREGGEAATSQDDQFQASSLSHSFCLASADNLRTQFTNYVKGFQSALDFIWYDRKRLKVSREIPLPTENEVAGYIPSQRFPSDHLSVVFDLEWRGSSSEEEEWRPQVHNRVFPAVTQHISLGASVLRLGGIAAVPTDTLYGLAASAEVGEGIRRLYAVKKRLVSKPVAICVATPSDVCKYGDCSSLPSGLLEQLLPGPVTVVLTRIPQSKLSEDLNPGVTSIGIRVPDAPFILQLCQELGGALALTSANLSGAASSLRVADFKSIWHQCGAVFDAGAIPETPAGSTIVDLSEQGAYKITRPGIAETSTVNVLESYGLIRRQ